MSAITLRRTAHRLGGHVWTVLADARHRIRPTSLRTPVPWSLTVEDGHAGQVRLSGQYDASPDRAVAVLIVHGLGGSSESGYCRAFAGAAARRGWSSLRIDLRGADGSGEDVYHAGLAEDLRSAISSGPLADHARVHVIGVSLGGHAALRLALGDMPRLGSVAAISSPLDLAASGRAIDRRRAFAYRHHVLRSLKHAYRRVATRHGSGPRVPSPVHVVNAARTLREWDRTVIVPRHGFENVDHYYESMSVGPRLPELARPVLYLGSPFDPMVPGHTVLPSLNAAGDRLRVEMLDRGGHVGLPAPALDHRVPRTLWDQVVGWLATPR